MGDIVINAKVFFERLSALYASWKQDKRSSDGIFSGADSIVVVTGKAEQESVYQKNNALHVSHHRSGVLGCRLCKARARKTDGNSSSGCWAMSSLRP